MDSVIDRITTIPKMIGGFLTTAAGAIASDLSHKAVEAIPAKQISMLPDTLVGWATCLAGFGTFGLCVLRGIVEYRRARKAKEL